MKLHPLVAVLLAVLLGLFFAPAAVAGPDKTPDQTPNDHPSGKDRSDEPSDGKTQGSSPSDPDGDANGGADKPGMDGGFDDDKDGNNGCGNDDDFEDDNNGWCGGKPKADAAANARVKSSDAKSSTSNNKLATWESRDERLRAAGFRNGLGRAGSVETGEQAAQVLGVSFVRSVATTSGAAGAGGDVEVAAASATAAAPSGTLARTGRNVLSLAAIALALCNIGAVLVTLASRRKLEPIPVRVDGRR